MTPYEIELATAVLRLGASMDLSEDPLVNQAIGNLGNYLWWRLQAKNCKVLNDTVAERKAEEDCKRYKALLPKEWQW